VNYKDTILKQSQIKWHRPPVKYIDDGKLDLVLNIPLTAVIEGQAEQSFFLGACQALGWIGEMQESKEPITQKMLDVKLKEWGIYKLYRLAQIKLKEVKKE
jgi:hypothetical protein